METSYRRGVWCPYGDHRGDYDSFIQSTFLILAVDNQIHYHYLIIPNLQELSSTEF